MEYCKNESVATVKYKAGGKDEQFSTKKTPISVECKLPVKGKYIYTVRGSGYNTETCTPTGLMNFSKEVTADSYEVRGDAVPVPGYEKCVFYNVVFLIGTEIVDTFLATTQYEVTFIPNPNYSEFPTLIIKNSTGGILFKKSIKDCNSIAVVCGDNCPPNHLRCECTHYPGYCCIPCADIKAGVSQATSTLRQVRA